MSHDHPAPLPSEKLLDECDVKFVRRSGPGGQHRNKVSTGVVLVHRPTGVKAEAAERRSQAENRAAALFRLRINLALKIRRPVKETAPSNLLKKGATAGLSNSAGRNSRKNTAGQASSGAQTPESQLFQRIASPLWRTRCRGGRIEINAGHDDFPALLAEALDLLAANDFDPRHSAETLGCSASQLIKLLKKEPRAMAEVNEERRRRELHLLR